ncbi:MAG: helix-turn-helix domain-containing protein [Ardenticatenaceae bacterium]
MALYVRELTEEEITQLREWKDGEDKDLKHRSKVILLSGDGYRIPEISSIVKAHPTNLRKWVHRFNQRGPDGLISPRSGGPPPRFTEEQKEQIAELAQQRPRDLGLNFSRWTLHKLADQAAKREIVDSISHEYVRQILKAREIDYRRRWPPTTEYDD